MASIDELVRSEDFVEFNPDRFIGYDSKFLKVLGQERIPYCLVAQNDGVHSNILYVQKTKLDIAAQLYIQVNAKREAESRRLREDPVQVIWGAE